LDVMGLLVLHLGKDLRIDFPLSHGRVEWPLGLRIIHTICIVGRIRTKCFIGISIDICKMPK
jgi:hypothetical protein